MTQTDTWKIDAKRVRIPLAANQRLLFSNSGAIGSSSEFYVAANAELHIGDGTVQGALFIHSQGATPGTISLQSGAFYAQLFGGVLTATRNYTLPNITGTVHVAPQVAAGIAPLYSAGYPLFFVDDAVTPHYWSAYIDAAGAWVITDLGTTPP